MKINLLFLQAFIAGIFACSLFAETPQKPGEARYQVIDLGPLPALADDVSASISDSGVITAWTMNSSGSVEAVVGTPNNFKNIGMLPGDSSNISHALNNHGQVVGWSVAGKNLVDNLVAKRAFLYSDNRLVFLGNFGGRDSQALAINNKSEIVGTASLPDKSKHAFLYTKNKLQDLGTLPGGTYSIASAINDSQVIAGAATTPDFFIHAVMWKHEKLTDIGTLPEGKRSRATAINSSGNIVGFSEVRSGEIHAFLYRDGMMKDLGGMSGGPVQANSINDRNQIVGRFSVDDRPHAFLWEDEVLTDLNQLISSDDKWLINEAYSINNHGQIVGYGSQAGKSGRRLLLLNPIEDGSPKQKH